MNTSPGVRQLSPGGPVALQAPRCTCNAGQRTASFNPHGEIRCGRAVFLHPGGYNDARADGADSGRSMRPGRTAPTAQPGAARPTDPAAQRSGKPQATSRQQRSQRQARKAEATHARIAALVVALIVSADGEIAFPDSRACRRCTPTEDTPMQQTSSTPPVMVRAGDPLMAASRRSRMPFTSRAKAVRRQAKTVRSGCKPGSRSLTPEATPRPAMRHPRSPLQ